MVARPGTLNRSNGAPSMAKPLIGVIGGSGLYHLAGFTATREEPASRRPGAIPPTRCASAISATPRSCFSPATAAAIKYSPSTINYRANIDALKRAGCHRHHRGLRLRLLQARPLPRPVRAGRSVHRPHLQARDEFLRHRLCRARAVRASCLALCSPSASRSGGRGGEHRRAARAEPTSAWRARSSRPTPNRCITRASAPT